MGRRDLSSLTVVDVVRTVSPALERHTADLVSRDLWTRPQLSARDRRVIALLVLSARIQSTDSAFYLDLALDSRLKSSEISKVIARLAFYPGCANATAVVKAANVLSERLGTAAGELPPASVELLPVVKAAGAERDTPMQGNFGAVMPGVVQFTRDTLFNDLWLRPGPASQRKSRQRRSNNASTAPTVVRCTDSSRSGH
ncbi:carboxymuconolactone decarboxylase family protein [Caballeronia novacaledonica]|uniref:carboxymuconolactone decarboxylase family protein n=1 Tax=Caballeronia novacaledonica TaxID=1544861 RepID=UPI0038573334